MEIETLLGYGASTRGCGQLRERKGVTTVAQLGQYVRGYREAKARYPRTSYRFHTYLDCEQLGPDSGDKLLEAYERWEQAVLHQQKRQDEPHGAMV